MTIPNQARPDFSDVSGFAPEIDFPQWEEDTRIMHSNSHEGHWTTGAAPAQAKAADAVGRAAKTATEYLRDILVNWYPAKAAQLDEIVSSLFAISREVSGTQIGPADPDQDDYAKMQQEYERLREFLSSLERMEEEDAHQEE